MAASRRRAIHLLNETPESCHGEFVTAAKLQLLFVQITCITVTRDSPRGQKRVIIF